MAELERLVVRLEAENRDLKRKLNQSTGQMNKFGNSAKKVGSLLAGAFAADRIIRGIGTSIRKIADFELQMDKVAAISRASGKEIQDLSKNALELGASSKFTATEIGSMQEELARLGFTTQKIIASTDAIRKLATAAGTGLAPAAQTMAGTMKSFNIQATESERVANVMAESFASTSLDLNKFNVSMANVGALAHVAGVSIERTTALIGTLTDRNIDASKAGTDLRTIFQELSNKGLTFNEAMEKITNSTDQVKTATDLFNKRAATSAVIIANNRSAVDKLTASFSDANAELDQMVATMEDNLHTDLKLLESAFDGLIQKGGKLNPVLRNIVQSLTDMITPGASIFGGEDVKFIEEVREAAQGLGDPIIHFKNGVEDLVRNDLKKAVELVYEWNRAEEKRAQFLQEGLSMYNEWQDRQKGVNDASNQGVGIIQKLKDRAEELGQALLNATSESQIRVYNKELKKVESELQRLINLGTQMSVSMPGQVQGQGILSVIMGGQIDDIDRATSAMERLAGGIKKVSMEMQGATVIAANQFGMAFKEIGDISLDVGAILREFATTTLIAFAEELGNALSGASNFGQGMMEAVSGFMKQLGAAMIQLGIAKTIADAFVNVPGPAIIAAGVALVAASQVVKNSMASGISGGGSIGGGGGAGPGSTGQGLRRGVGSSRNTEQTINIVGKIKGDDLVFMQEKAVRNRGIRG